jgi:hypothetical protein
VLPRFDRVMYFDPEHGGNVSDQHRNSDGDVPTATTRTNQNRLLIAKLGEELRQHSANLEQMLRLNSAWRQAGCPKSDDDSGWRKVADLYGCADNDLRRIRADLRNWLSRQPPFSEHELANRRECIASITRQVSALED